MKPAHPLYPHLLSPLDVGPFTLQNRVLMGSMHVGMEDDIGPLKKLGAYFARRAEGKVGLMVTGGVAPNMEGWLKPLSSKLTNRWEVYKHRAVTDAVQGAGGRIVMQILHAGRYGYHPFCVSASSVKSPISMFKPRELSPKGIERTINAFVRCAVLAKKAGYDGVEVMGSEGYLINQFIVQRTNHRDDAWGGPYARRIRFPVEIVRRTREAVGDDFLIIFRLSMLDLVEQGSTWEEVVELAQALEAAGVSILNTGIGWHEARVPTIATSVPRAGFSWVTQRLKGHVNVPLITSNRINMPDTAEEVLARGDADMVSMARPFLADPDWVLKAMNEKADDINTCIACNQACLDHVFKQQRASCLVNPFACYETEMVPTPVRRRKKLAVVGSGPAGMSFASVAAERGHEVVVYDQADEVGGQFNMAKKVPGKEEFQETLRYYGRRMEQAGVTLKLGTRVDAALLQEHGADAVILATGVHPRQLKLSGIDHPKVLSYIDVLRGGAQVGQKVAIIGAGGIGFDVAEFLVQGGPLGVDDPKGWLEGWGVDVEHTTRGGLKDPVPHAPKREVFLCQRSEGKLGARLGKTTGWIHRAELKKANVDMIGGVTYTKIDDDGLHIEVDGVARVLEVDHVVVCAGQVPNRDLQSSMEEAGFEVHLIGGADVASELDAKRAMRQGAQLAIEL